MPRTETHTVTIYRFHELSPAAKDSARQWYQCQGDGGYNWSEEALDSLKALAQHFGAKLSRYEIDWGNNMHSAARFDVPDLSRAEIGVLLGQLGAFNPETLCGDGECKLTGFCHDESAIDGFRIAFMRYGKTELAQLLEAGFRSWLAACHADYDDFYSDEQFAEHCEANDYEFTKNGEFYR